MLSLALIPGLMCDHNVWDPLLPALSGQVSCHIADNGNADSLMIMAQQILDTGNAGYLDENQGELDFYRRDEVRLWQELSAVKATPGNIDCTPRSTIGPMMIINSSGKTKTTSGNSIFTGSCAANSSAFN